MNAITYAIQWVQRYIPQPILKHTFITLMKHRTTIPVTVATRISEEIIYKQVMPDMNIIGGTTILVPLDQCTVLSQDRFYTVYHVPKKLTDNRKIVSVHELTVAGHYVASGAVSTNLTSEAANAASQMVASTQSLPYVSEARTQLLSENTLMVELPYHLATNNVLRCVVEYDTNLNNINPRSTIDFAELVLLATKAYIYNENRIPIGQGYIMGGASIDAYKDEIDSYSDAQEKYLEMLKTKWAIIDKLNDFETRKRLITLMTGRAM